MIGAAFGPGFVLGPTIRPAGPFEYAHTGLFRFGVDLREPHFRRDVPAGVARSGSELATRFQGSGQTALNLPTELTRYRLGRLFGLSFVATSAIAAFEATFAMMVPLVYGYGPSGVGGLFAFAGLTQAITQGYLLGKIVKRTGELPLIRAGLVLLALGLAPMASLRSHALLLVTLALLAIGYGLASPPIASLISKRTARDKQGEVLGANQSAQSLARIAGPIMEVRSISGWGRSRSISALRSSLSG